MTFNEEIKKAKSQLSARLVGWSQPNVKLLPVPPVYAAACLRLSLIYRHPPLAYAATKNLALFGEHFLWNVLLAFAATQTSVFQSCSTLAILASRRDRAWIRRKGGTIRVASFIADDLLRAPRSSCASELWRLAHDDEVPNHSAIKRGWHTAREIRGRLLSGQHHGLKAAWFAGAAPNDLMSMPQDSLTLEIADAAFKQTQSPEALMVPIIHSLAGTTTPTLVYRTEQCTGSQGQLPESDIPIVALLGKHTPHGRRAIRTIIQTLPRLLGKLETLAIDQDEALEIIGDLIERSDLEFAPFYEHPFNALRSMSRWSAIGILDRHASKSLGSILEENASVVTEIRLANIPSSLTDFMFKELPSVNLRPSKPPAKPPNCTWSQSQQN